MTERDGGRPSPWSPEAEISVLGAAFIDEDAVAEARAEVDPKDFFEARHQRIWRAMCSLYDEGEAIDPVTLTDRLKRDGALDDAGGHSYVAELLDAVPTAANVTHHVRIVREKAQLRRVIAACRRTIRDAHEANGDGPGAVVEAAERRIFEAAETRSKGGFRPAKDALWRAMEAIEEEGRSDLGVTGIATGVPSLDRATSGLHPGDLTILAARPAMGKTSMALGFAAHAAGRGETVAIASLEMSDAQVVKRLLAMRADVDLMKVRKGTLEREEYESIARASAWFNSAPLRIDDQLSATVPDLRAKVRRLASREDVALVVVDYIQLMEAEGRNRVEQVTRISRGLKMAAREFDVHMLGISQLSRAPERRNSPEPYLSDLRESGSIEQDADTVLLLYRPEYYFGKDTPDEKWARWRGKAILKVAKQRNGPTPNLELRWHAQTTTFSEPASDADEKRAERDRPWH